MSLIRFLYDFHVSVCLICLFLILRLFLLLYAHYDGLDFTRCVFSTYIPLFVFDTNVISLLQFTICVNCFRLTPQSRKWLAPLSLSSSSSGAESPSSLGHMSNTGFTPVNSALSPSGIKSLSLFVRCKQAYNR